MNFLVEVDADVGCVTSGMWVGRVIASMSPTSFSVDGDVLFALFAFEYIQFSLFKG